MSATLGSCCRRCHLTLRPVEALRHGLKLNGGAAATLVNDGADAAELPMLQVCPNGEPDTHYGLFVMNTEQALFSAANTL